MGKGIAGGIKVSYGEGGHVGSASIINRERWTNYDCLPFFRDGLEVVETPENRRRGVRVADGDGGVETGRAEIY